MKGRFLAVTSTDNKTVYVPLSRLLRIEALPPDRGATASAVAIVFEGFQVNVQTSHQGAEIFAKDLYERLIGPEDVDLVYLRSEPGKGVNVQF